MFTLAICQILNGYAQVFFSKILLIQTYHTICVSFSCQFIWVIFRLLSDFDTTALLNVQIYSIFLWLLLLDLIGSLMKLL